MLVVQGGSAQFNPTLDPEMIAAAEASDPEAAISEWHGGFRSDIGAFLSDDLVEAAIDHDRPLELPPRRGRHDEQQYRCFVDASGGRGDAYAVAIAHKESEQFVCDVVRGKHPPFDPQAVTREFAELAKQYGVLSVVGDAYSAEWVSSAWSDAGVRYERSERSKSELYLECLPLFARGVVRLPRHARLVRELKLLERHTHRSGRDTIDHGRSGSDDFANAVAGCLATLAKRGYCADLSWVGPVARTREEEWALWRRQRLHNYCLSGGNFTGW